VLVADACVVAEAALEDAVVESFDVAPSAPATTDIHLKEDKLHVQLGDKAKRSARWILDMGTINHMTGELSAFSSMDNNVRGTVRFGDGSVTAIRGHGTIVLRCRNGNHKALTGVYHIPRPGFSVSENQKNRRS
jgi:hypothetical protein